MIKRLLPLIAIFLWSSALANAAWALKNNKWVGGSTSNPAVTPAFSNALTPGSIIFVYVAFSYSSAATPYDTAGNTYIDCGAGVVGSGGAKTELFYALNSYSTASNVISVTNSGNYSVEINAAEFTGNASSSPVDTYATQPSGNTGTGGGQNETAGPITPAVSGELIIGGQTPNNGITSAGTNFTSIGYYAGMEYQSYSSTNPVSATWSNGTNNTTYTAIVAAFKPPTTGTAKGFAIKF